ncbi:hypothetical protein B0H21DRAFT_35700 [Amylocystis lapponica]|nr:hypothetical protein B0H21DRAFT_35700 [Amylocystis lapponica]
MGNGPCIPSACVHPELRGLRDVGIPIKAAAAASHSPNFSLHRQPRSSAHRHICVVIASFMLGLNDIFDLPAYNGELFEDGALTFEVPDAGTDLDWVDFVAQLLALPADPVVDLPWQVSFCPEHFAPANMPFSGHLSDVHPPPPPPLPPPPPPQPQPVADILVFRPAAEVETTEVLQPSQQMAEPEREDVVEAAAEVAGGWEAAPEVEVGVGADVEVEVAAEVAPVPVAAVTVEAPIAGPSRQVRVVVEAPIAGPSRQVRVAEVEPSRKRKREEDDKENQPCKRTAAGPHGCLFSGCMSHIQGTVRDVRRHMDRHFPRGTSAVAAISSTHDQIAWSSTSTLT